MKKKSATPSNLNPSNDPDVEDCIKLWRGVLVQAFLDLLTPPFPNASRTLAGQMRSCQRSAARWLRGGCDDLHQVCAWAALDESVVEDLYRQSITTLRHGTRQERMELKRAIITRLFNRIDLREPMMNYE